MWLQNLRITVRSLGRTPGVTLAAVTALTLGLGPWVEPQALIGPAQQKLEQAAGGVPVSGVRPIRAALADSLADADLSLLIASTFAAVAVVLAATGVYGAALLCLVALFAVWLPARQASRVEPAIALQTE